MDIKYDYSALRGRIKQKLGTERKYAEKIGISKTSLSSKLNNKTYFSQNEIDVSCNKNVLDIKQDEVGYYFFTRKVELNSTK